MFNVVAVLFHDGVYCAVTIGISTLAKLFARSSVGEKSDLRQLTRQRLAPTDGLGQKKNEAKGLELITSSKLR